MFLVELVLQGVRGFRQLARLRYKRGFNFISAGNESGKTTAVDAVVRLLFTEKRNGHPDEFVSRHAPDGSRSALVLHADDGVYYRIIQDFSKRAVSVSRYDSEKKEFNLLHKDWDNAGRFITALTGGIAVRDYEAVFTFRREQYGNQAASMTAATTPAERDSGGPPPDRAADARARIAELQESLKKAEEAADAEYRSQAAKLALDETAKKIAALDDLERAIGEADDELQGLKGCETLPENLPSLIDDAQFRQGRTLAAIDEANRELEGLKAELAAHPQANIFTSKLFIAGAILGVLSILAGVFLLTARQAYYFPAGVTVSLACMAAAVFKGSRKNSQRKIILKETDILGEEIAGLEKQLKQEHAPLQEFMDAAGVSTPEELKEKADKYRHLLSLRAEREDQRRRILGDLVPEALRQEYEKERQAALEMEKAALDVAQYNIDTYGIRQDIERLEASVSGDSTDVSGEAEPSAVVETPSPAAGDTGFRAALDAACRISGAERDELIPLVEAAAREHLSTSTNGRYGRIELTAADGTPVVYAADGSAVNDAELSHGTRDLILFCLRTGLVDALSSRRRLPFLLDDPLSGFDPARQRAACQVLRGLGHKTQVILFSSNTALKAAGDAAAELG